MQYHISELNQENIFAIMALNNEKLSTATVNDILAAAMGENAQYVMIPVDQIEDDFFNLSLGIAGEIIQKFVNYQFKLVIVGDIAPFTTRSKALTDFVYESNLGQMCWFLANENELALKLNS